MVFNSYIFILVYLPVCVAGWFLINRVNHKAADWFLIAMSIGFYGCFGFWYLVVLGVSSLFNYALGCVLEKRGQAKGWLAFGIAMNLLFLGWFKYISPELTMLAENGSVTWPAGWSDFIALGLPVGLSFYTFSLISYLVDKYRGELCREPFREYLLYVTYFPKIIQGPITCYEEVASQFRDRNRRRFDPEGFARGLCLFIMGLAKKLLIADVLSGPASYGIQSAYYLDTLSVITAFSCYALQLYMDFSGYCDMAMGISRMLNIELPLNFNAPFQAESFPEFWKRWHMTLTRFFTRYVYIPLGGSRKGSFRTFVNVMLVFVLSGFWHGFGGTYLVWGALSGILVAMGNVLHKRRVVKDGRQETPASCRQKQHKRTKENAKSALRRAGVYLLFLFTLIFFGAPSLEYSGAILRRFLVFTYPGWLYRMAAKLDMPEFWLLNKLVSAAAPGLADVVLLAELLGMLALSLLLVNRKRTAVTLSETMALNVRNAVLLGALLVMCLCSVSGVSTYLYFQF
jgi:alginate O-acetyltransferase complex protein AlgI